jgi:two-component system LytT family response regulator
MKFIIIEDEPAAAKRLKNMVIELRPDAECLSQLESISDSITWLSENEGQHLIFQDINLADGNSFEIFNHIEVKNPIIFTTAYDEYAIDAFKVNTIDYLLKPIKKTDLSKALAKMESQTELASISYKKLAEALHGKEPQNRFLIRIGQKLKVVNLKDVAYFYTFNKITFLITNQGQRFPLDYTMEGLEKIIDQDRYFRINRQFIICVDAIAQMTAYSKSRVKIALNPSSEFETIVSTDKSPLFKKWLSGSMVKD